MRLSLSVFVAMSAKSLKWAAIAGWFAAGVLIIILFAAHRPQPKKEIIIRSVRQDAQLDPLPLSATNAPLVLLEYVNTYRTEPGWIAASNDRIYAGLVDRVWSAAYTAPVYRHTLNLLAGSGFGVQYTYAIAGRYPIGGMILYSGGVKIFACAGFQW